MGEVKISSDGILGLNSLPERSFSAAPAKTPCGIKPTRKFVPFEDGDYIFDIDSDRWKQISIDSPDIEEDIYYNRDYESGKVSVYLEAGKTYYLYIYLILFL